MAATVHSLKELREKMGEQTYTALVRAGVATEVAATETAKFLKQFEACRCTDGMQTIFCMYGHMTECHYPLDCLEANCSHAQADMDDEDDIAGHEWEGSDPE